MYSFLHLGDWEVGGGQDSSHCLRHVKLCINSSANMFHCIERKEILSTNVGTKTSIILSAVHSHTKKEEFQGEKIKARILF